MSNTITISAIKPFIHQRLFHKFQNNCIIFKEKDKNARLKNIQISGLNSVIPINQDLISFPNEIFSDNIEYKKTCDGVLIFEFDGVIEVLIFDVKSSMSNKQEHSKKLKCGRNYFLYLANTLKLLKDIDILEAPCYYCIFVLNDAERRPTSIQPSCSKNPDEPVYIRVREGETISIKKILGRPII